LLSFTVFSKGEKVKNVILEALRKRYEAQIAEADATIKIYFENSVGIGEHPQHIDEVDKLIEKISTAEEKLEVIKEFE
jgi:predicted sugar kinase